MNPNGNVTSSQLSAAAAFNEKELEATQQLMAQVRRHLTFDAHIIGIGERQADGSVLLRRCCASDNLPASLVSDYVKVAAWDSAGQLFSCLATSVQAIPTLEAYPDTSSKAGRVGKYLRKNGIAQLLLAGVDSSYGLAWVTLYRRADPELLMRLAKGPADRSASARARDKALLTRLNAQAQAAGVTLPPPHGIREFDALQAHVPAKFSGRDAETASYIVRGALFEWQIQSAQRRREVDPAQYELIRLTPHVLDVALRVARGFTNDDLVEAFKGVRKAKTVLNQKLEATKEYGGGKEIAERLLGKLPGIRMGSDASTSQDQDA